MKKMWFLSWFFALSFLSYSPDCLALGRVVSPIDPHLFRLGIFIGVLAVLGFLIKGWVEYRNKKDPGIYAGHFPKIMPGIHIWMCPDALKTFPSEYLNKDVIVRAVGRDRTNVRLYVDQARSNYCLLKTTSDMKYLTNDVYFFSFQYNTDSVDFDKINSSTQYRTPDGLLWEKSASLRGEVGIEILDCLTGASIEVPYKTVAFERLVGEEDTVRQKEYLLFKEINHPALDEVYCQMYIGIHLSTDHCLSADLIGDYCEH